MLEHDITGNEGAGLLHTPSLFWFSTCKRCEFGTETKELKRIILPRWGSAPLSPSPSPSPDPSRRSRGRRS